MRRSGSNNPFTPGFGDARVWVERTVQAAQAETMVHRAVAGALQAPRLIEQERGYGKTTLLAAFADQVTEWSTDPIVVRVAAVTGEPFLLAFAHRLVESLHASRPVQGGLERVNHALGRIRMVRLAGLVEVAWADDDVDTSPSLALEQALVELGTAARGDGDRPVVLLIDEAQAIDAQSRRAVFTAIQAATTRQDERGRVLPFAILLAGLPGTRAAFKRDKVTFGERCRDMPLDALDDESVRATLLRFDEYNDVEVRFTPDAIEALIDACGGHPHLFQLVGEGAWTASPDAAEITSADVVAGQAESARERAMIVAARLDGLTDAQLGWARAAATLDDDERSLTAICRAYRGTDTVSASECGSLAASLLDQGVVRRSRDRHRIVFALAGMRDFLR